MRTSKVPPDAAYEVVELRRIFVSTGASLTRAARSLYDERHGKRESLFAAGKAQRQGASQAQSAGFGPS